MDGVLIDAREWHYESLNDALECFGQKITREEHLIRFDGLPTRDKLKILSSEGRCPRRLHGLINKLKQKFTINHILRKCGPNFQHEYALSRFKKEGYKIALASNSIRDTVNLMMSRSELEKYLDLTMTANDVEKSKPNPEIYITTISKLNLKPSECLIIEDNHHGIIAAEGAKAHVLKVNNVLEVNYNNISNKIREIN